MGLQHKDCCSPKYSGSLRFQYLGGFMGLVHSDFSSPSMDCFSLLSAGFCVLDVCLFRFWYTLLSSLAEHSASADHAASLYVNGCLCGCGWEDNVLWSAPIIGALSGWLWWQQIAVVSTAGVTQGVSAACCVSSGHDLLYASLKFPPSSSLHLLPHLYPSTTEIYKVSAYLLVTCLGCSVKSFLK